MEMDPYEQVVVAAAVCFFVSTVPGHANVLFKDIVTRQAGGVCTVKRSILSSLHGVSLPVSFQVLPIFVGFDALRGPYLAEALTRLPSLISRFDNMECSAPIILSPDELVTKQVVKMEEMGKYQKSCGTIRNTDALTQWFGNGDVMKGTNTSILFVLNLPPLKEPLSKPAMDFEEPYKTNLGVRSCIKHMTEQLGQDKVHVLVFAPRNRTPEATAELLASFEHQVVIPPEQEIESVANVPDIFASRAFEWVRILNRGRDAQIPLEASTRRRCMKREYVDDNCTWKLTELLESQILQTKQLSQKEMQMKQDFEWTAEETGEKFFPGREWWCEQFGLVGGGALTQYLNATSPCAARIYPSTGMLCPEGATKQTKCGVIRYCKMCEYLIRDLHRSYSAETMLTSIAIVLLKLSTTAV